MALKDLYENLNPYCSLIPALLNAPAHQLWSSYDEDGDVLYIRFAEGQEATDSELTDNDVIIRYAGEEIVGITILHASQR